jgi:hypothetical protein
MQGIESALKLMIDLELSARVARRLYLDYHAQPPAFATTLSQEGLGRTYCAAEPDVLPHRLVMVHPITAKYKPREYRTRNIVVHEVSAA